MMFTNNRVHPKKTTPMFFMARNPPMTNWKQRSAPKNVNIVTADDYIMEVENRRNGKKILWGEPFWNLFHVLAEKVGEDNFTIIRMELLNLIYTICSNLPCPDCKNHAVRYLNGVNFKTIKSKDQLKTMLFDFHNVVNVRKSYPLFPRNLLDSKYECANIISIINDFLKSFSHKHKGSFGLIADDMHRQKLISTLSKWFTDNLQHFSH